MTKLNKSWERTRSDGVHSPEGVETLRRDVKRGLTRLYTGMAESMFTYDFPPEMDTMLTLSQGTVPERFLFENGQAVFFRDPAGDLQCLPFVMNSDGINIYGKPVSWSPVPVGWQNTPRPFNPAITALMSAHLTYEDSVIIRNDLFGEGDKAYVEAMVSELVDNVLTLNQLQLISKMPFVFNTSEDNVLTAKNYFLMLSSDKPVIFTNSLGEDTRPKTEPLSTGIDTALFDLYDRWESQLLTYLGIPNVPITKRAQQTVSEVQSNDTRLYLRRQEKLRQRQAAMNRLQEVFGVTCTVTSVIDDLSQPDPQADGQGTERAVSDPDPTPQEVA